MSNNTIKVGGSVDQSVLIAGNRNQVTQASKQEVSATNPGELGLALESLTEVRSILLKYAGPETGKTSRALQDVEEELSKPEPNKLEIASALERAVKYAKAGGEFGKAFSDLEKPLTLIAKWVGVAVPATISLFGLLR